MMLVKPLVPSLAQKGDSINTGNCDYYYSLGGAAEEPVAGQFIEPGHVLKYLWGCPTTRGAGEFLGLKGQNWDWGTGERELLQSEPSWVACATREGVSTPSQEACKQVQCRRDPTF